MNFIDQVRQGLQNIWDGVARIFSPTDDDYPQSGAQPYEGDPADDRD